MCHIVNYEFIVNLIFVLTYTQYIQNLQYDTCPQKTGVIISRKGSRSLQTSWFGPVIYDKFSVTVNIVNIGISYCVVNYQCLDVMKSTLFNVRN